MNEESYCDDCDLSIHHTETQDPRYSFTNCETTPTPCKVMGRKINSSAMLTSNQEGVCKYPLPVQITGAKAKKSSKHQLQDISNRPRSHNSKQRFKSKTPEPAKANQPKNQQEPKKPPQQKTTKKSTTAAVLPKPTQKKSKISVEIPLVVKENSVMKKNINSIVMQTLKKQHIQKRRAEKSKNEEKERQSLMKKQLAELNQQTRVENYNRFKQERFQPKYPWGTDERRITRQNDVKILKDAEELRKKRREERDRSKSAGKSRIGLDVLKLKKDQSRIIEEEIPPKKPNRERNKSIIQYMKKQRKQRQKSKELQQERAREDEHKRLLQLLELEKLTRKSMKRHKSSKLSRKKTPKKDDSGDESRLNDSEDGEIIKILRGARSVTPGSYEINPHITSFDTKQNGRECMVFGLFPESINIENKGNGTQLVNEIVEKRPKREEELPQASATMPLADVKESCSVIHTEEEYKESVSSDISRRKDEIRKKLSELRTRVDKAKDHKSEDLDDKRMQAAIKIQAWVRGFLTRLALQQYFDQSQGPSEGYDWDFNENPYEETSNSYEDSEVRRIIKNESSSSAMATRNEHKFQDRLARKQQDLEKILLSQAQWREVQKEKLFLIKKKDLEEMRNLAKKLGSEDVLMRFFEEIIERRYTHINQLFDENMEAVASALQQAIEDDNTESLLHTLEKQENFASEMFQNLEKAEDMNDLMKIKNQFDFGNIWNYSEGEEQSVRISELDIASNSHRSVQNGSCSSEMILKSVRFEGTPRCLGQVDENLEPVPAVFIEYAVEKIEDFICEENYLEAIYEAWDSLLTCSLFINDTAERVLQSLLSQESDFFISFDLSALKSKPPEKKKEHRPGDVPPLELRPLQPIGIEMDENYLLKYIGKLFDFLSQCTFDMEKSLNTANSFSPLEMLCKMQEAEIGVIIEKSPNFRVLPLDLYLELEKDAIETSPLIEAQHIHNKLLFDVVNENLLGKCCKANPLPWSFNNRNVTNKPVMLSAVIGEIIDEIKQLNKVRAGKVPKIDFISNSEDTEEELVQQLREEQLSCMLALEIVAQEPSWINYEFEETQVKLDIADMTLEELVEETIHLLGSPK